MTVFKSWEVVIPIEALVHDLPQIHFLVVGIRAGGEGIFMLTGEAKLRAAQTQLS